MKQQGSQQASSNWECSSLQSAYKAALLQHGQAPADLQHLISLFAAAVLRVSQVLGSAAGHLLQQRAFSAAEQVHSQLASLQRDQQLLSVARGALACAASPTGCLQQPGTAPRQGMDQLLQDPLQGPLQQRLQEHAGLSWKQTLQQLHDHEDDGTKWPAVFPASSNCSTYPGQAFN